MRIGLITDHLRGGGKERRIVELVKALSRQNKFEFVIVMLDGHDKDDCAYNEIYGCPVSVHYFGGLSKMKKVLRLSALAREEKLDLIHFWAPPIYAYMLLPIWIRTKIPIISSSITSARKQGGNSFWLVKCSYFLFQKILSNSLQALRVNEVPKNKALCIYNGFDPQRAIIKRPPESVRSEMSINSRFIVSMAAEYSYRKDWPMFVDAAKRLVEQGLDVTFIAMGSGDSDGYISRIGDNPIAKERIRFVGRVSDVESVFNASDVVVLASCIEGISNSILEGMALGKPIVSTKGPFVGTSEIVEDGGNGFLVEYHDYVAFANKIAQLLNDENMRKGMGERSKQIVQNKFGIDKMTDAFADVYRVILKER